MACSGDSQNLNIRVFLALQEIASLLEILTFFTRGSWESLSLRTLSVQPGHPESEERKVGCSGARRV